MMILDLTDLCFSACKTHKGAIHQQEKCSDPWVRKGPWTVTHQCTCRG